MRLHQHAIVSTAISAGIFAVTRSWVLALGSFAAGTLIDLDHLLDYWLQHPVKMDVKHFFKTCEEYRLKKVYIILHSIELLLIIGIVAYITRNKILLALALGFSQHFVFDYIVNGVFPSTYFFSYRYREKFINERIFIIPPEYRTK